MEYDTSSVPTLARFMKSRKHVRMAMGPFGSGKSTACVQELLQIALRQKPGEDGVRRTRFAVVRNSYPQLRDSTIRTWLDWFPDGVWGRYRVAEHEYEMRFMDKDGVEVHCEILFRALDRPDQIGNLLSTEYTAAWFNEARDIPKGIFDAMTGRVGRFPSAKDGVGCTWDGIILDTNPPDDDHWLYQLFEVQRPAGYEAFYQPSGLSNKAENIPNLKKGYYKRLAAGKDEDWIRVYVDGEYGYVKTGKPVYPQYNDKLHCKPFETVKDWPLYRGWDFGTTPACVFAQLSPTGQLLLRDEMVADRAGIQEFGKAVLEYTDRHFHGIQVAGDYADPAGKQGSQQRIDDTCFNIMWGMGISVEEGIQDPEIRLDAVKSKLNGLIDGEPALLVHPDCTNIRKGFRGAYAYKRINVGVEAYVDKPDKNSYSHPHDALQYLCTRLFGTYGSSMNSRPPRVVGMGGGRHL